MAPIPSPTIRRRSRLGWASSARRRRAARSTWRCTIASPGCEDVPLYALLDLPTPVALPTSFTIAISEPDEMARLASEASRYPILKIKLGSDDDAARLAAVRAARPDAILRVDANAGWSAEEAVARIDEIERFGLEMVEQPVAKHDIAGMGFVQAHTDLPVVADESVQSMARSRGAGGGRRARHQPEAPEGRRPGAGLAHAAAGARAGAAGDARLHDRDIAWARPPWRTWPAWPTGSTSTRRC